MTKKIWIVYKTESMSAPGWEERQLMPRGGLTNILWENWTWEENPEIPQVGEKTRDYENLSEPGNGVTHGKDGDWVVTRVQQFSALDTEERIVVCYCCYEPVTSDWEALQRVDILPDLKARGFLFMVHRSPLAISGFPFIVEAVFSPRFPSCEADS